jgi:hypothetical protein
VGAVVLLVANAGAASGAPTVGTGGCVAATAALALEEICTDEPIAA